MKESLLITVPVFIVAFLLSLCVTRSGVKSLLRSLLVTYIYFILSITLLGRTAKGTPEAELTLLWSWDRAFHGNTRLLEEIGLNVLLFIPFGVLLRLNWKIKIGWAFLLGLIFSIVIECSQYVSCRGLFEWDDMIDNTIGCLIGAVMASIIQKHDK